VGAVEAIEAESAGLTDDCAPQLANLPYFLSLRKLNLTGNRITDRGVDILVSALSRGPSALQYLAIGGESPLPVLCRRVLLCGSAAFGAVTPAVCRKHGSSSHFDCGVAPRGVGGVSPPSPWQFARACWVPRVAADNPISKRGVIKLVDWVVTSNVVKLNLSAVGMDDDLLAGVCERLSRSRVSSLLLCGAWLCCCHTPRTVLAAYVARAASMLRVPGT
jgi:hypothetical protein